jgi:hypothetical protein
MAGLKLFVNSGEVVFVANTAKTALQIKAPTNQRLLLKQIKVFGKQPAGGTDTPVKFRLTRSTANFGTGTTATPGKLNTSNPETIQSTAANNFTVEPTSPTDTAYWQEVQPQTGTIEFEPITDPIEVPGGTSIQAEITSVGTPTVTVVFEYEE